MDFFETRVKKLVKIEILRGGLIKKMNLRLGFDGFELGDIITGNIALLSCSLAPGKPPIALCIIQNLQVFAFSKTEIFIGACIIIVKSNENLGRWNICVWYLWHWPNWIDPL